MADRRDGASGTTISWARTIGTIVDKHSTGGVGDAVGSIAVPLPPRAA